MHWPLGHTVTVSALKFIIFVALKAVASAQRHGGPVETTQKCKLIVKAKYNKLIVKDNVNEIGVWRAKQILAQDGSIHGKVQN